jgi:hypothetical protein
LHIPVGMEDDRPVDVRPYGALAALIFIVAAPAASAQEFADWTTADATAARGTLLGQPISLEGSTSPVGGSVVDGSSTLFAFPEYTPPLTRSDAPEMRVQFPASAYVLKFGAAVTNPVLHLGSLGSTAVFAAGTAVTRVSGDPGFTVAGAQVSESGPADGRGTIRLTGTFESVAFEMRPTANQDGVTFQVGAVAPPVPTVVPTVVPTPIPPKSTPIPTPVPLAPEPVVGVRVIAAPASGVVSIKLPGGDAFVPLGVTTPVPIGATVDARRGSLTFQAAGGATATLAAGIFKIRQARAAGAPTDLVLATPAGLARACAPGRRPPKKGIVRTLSVTTPKGVFRTVAAKGIVTGSNAAWTTTDRCDGTLTKVAKGRVSIKAGRRTIQVRAGHRYRLAARLFGARKTRG